ncbi:MAG: hypothetical protein LBU68_02580 [Rickettsiales bacterium]|jgi:hypothetical protein|nr:hypothetical protein [Rickettsiales bacterium]
MQTIQNIILFLKKIGIILCCVFVFDLSNAYNVYSQEEEEFIEEEEYIEEEFIEDDSVEEEGVEVIEGDLFAPVKDFDISNFRIGMDYKSVIKLAKDMKYTVDKLVSDTPEYLRYNFDIICQKQKIFQTDALAACIDGYAKKTKMNYTKEIRLVKASTGEKINLFLTSPLTDNMVYRIEYKLDLMSLKGDQKKFLYEREENRRAFWYTVIEKYGQPNLPPNIWAYNPNDEFSTTMIVSFEGILIENRGMPEVDFIEGVKKARTTFKAIEFSF